MASKNTITSMPKRNEIIALWSLGESNDKIAETVGVKQKTTKNIINNFIERGHLFARKPEGRERSKATPEVVEFIEFCKILKPSIYAKEVADELLTYRVCTPWELPSQQTISNICRKDLGYTYKRLQTVPAESFSQANLNWTFNYIMYMSSVDPSKVHFFDESSVIRTTGNRSYGHSEKGKPAIEVQRYASNCTFTINLLHSRFGITNFGIIEGPSNGLEMLHFFQESLQMVDVYGNPLIAMGDIIVMDNCGFHHGQFAETELRRMLTNRNVELVFQPPYSPDFNTCEFCFRAIKAYLRRNEQFAITYTELAILNSLEVITPVMSHNIFKHCGFVL